MSKEKIIEVLYMVYKSGEPVDKGYLEIPVEKSSPFGFEVKLPESILGNKFVITLKEKE